MTLVVRHAHLLQFYGTYITTVKIRNQQPAWEQYPKLGTLGELSLREPNKQLYLSYSLSILDCSDHPAIAQIDASPTKML